MSGTIIPETYYQPDECILAMPQPTPPFTAADYLRWEAEQRDKHEYLRGETFAMGGTSRRHATLTYP